MKRQIKCKNILKKNDIWCKMKIASEKGKMEVRI